MAIEHVVFFDIDNCLYSASTAISQLMMQKIRQYFIDMGFDEHEAERLHSSYYRQYGLAIRGLVKHHEIDPLVFNERCDASLPLETLLKPDPAIRQLLLDLDRTKVSLWAATNAYVTHAERVLKILNLRDLFEGIIFCDYADPAFTCKPEPEYFRLAMTKAGLDPSNRSDYAKCLFVDDSLSNVRGAKNFGWKSNIWFREQLTPDQRAHLVSGEEAKDRSESTSVTGTGTSTPVTADEEKIQAHIRNPTGAYAEALKNSFAGGDGKDTKGVDGVISNLQELRHVWDYVFKKEDIETTS